MYYRINYKASNKNVLLESGTGAAPAVVAGYVDAGTFIHTDATDNMPGMQRITENHVLYQHVQDAMYKRGLLDMAILKIYVDTIRTLSIGTGTLTVAKNASSAPLTVTAVPANADKGVTFTSSNNAIATVDNKGVVKGIAAGNAVITATSTALGTVTATRNVTITP